MQDKRKLRDTQYKEKMRRLRKFVDFDYDLRKPLTKYQKTKINKYSKELDRLTKNKPYSVQVYKSKNRARLESVKVMGGNDSSLKGFKVAFVPKTSEHQKITFNKKGEPQIKSRHVTETFYEFDQERLALEGGAYAQSVAVKAARKSYAIKTGDWQLAATFPAALIGERIDQLQQAYSVEGANNHYSNWMLGLVGYDFTNQSDVHEYRREKRKAAIHAERKKAAIRQEKNVAYWRLSSGMVTASPSDNATEPESGATRISKKEFMAELRKMAK